MQRCTAQIPWRHNQVLIDKLNAQPERIWYAQQSLDNGWSRDVLVMQVESNLFQRQGGAVPNFERTIPPEQSDLAQQLIKDPYNFDFLNLTSATQRQPPDRCHYPQPARPAQGQSTYRRAAGNGDRCGGE